MALEVGEVNPKVFAILGVVGVVVGGYLFYSKMYKPAVVARDGAMTAMTASAQTLTDNQAKLKLKLDEAASNDKKGEDADRKALAEIANAKGAIPRGKHQIVALAQVEDIARKSGVTIITDKPDAAPDQNATPGESQTVVPMTITLEGHATYASIGVMLRRIQDTATVYKGKLYVSDRLLATKSFTIGDTGDGGGGGSVTDLSGNPNTGSSTEPVIPKNHIHFTITIEYYVDLTATDTASTTGSGTTDGTSASTNGSTTGGTAGGATSGTAGSTGGAASSTSTPTGGTGQPASGSQGTGSTATPSTSSTPASTG